MHLTKMGTASCSAWQWQLSTQLLYNSLRALARLPTTGARVAPLARRDAAIHHSEAMMTIAQPAQKPQSRNLESMRKGAG